MKIWTCGSSPRSGSRNAWTWIKNVNGASHLSNFWNFFRRDPNDFLSRLVTMDETWLYHYDPETKQQSMEWRHSGSPRPKKFRVQKSAAKVLVSIFFWDQDGILLIDYLHKGQPISAKYYSCLVVELKGILKERHRGAEYSPKGSCSCTTMSRLAGHLQSIRTSFICASNVFSPDLAPSDYHLFPGLKKTIEMSPFFVRRGGHCCRWDLVGRTNFWFFLSGLQNLEQRAKKCIELRGEYVE